MAEKNKIKQWDELPSTLTEEQEIYKENILDHYKHPRNKRKLAWYTASFHEHNHLCGDEITIFLRISNNHKIEEVSFLGQGCAISQAAASLLTEEIKGKSRSVVKKMTQESILSLLGIPISITRIKCAVLALKTAQNALQGIK